MNLFDGLRNAAGALADFVYPPICATCRRNLARGESYICVKCWDGFERVARTETIIQTIEEKFLADRALDKIDSIFLFDQDPRVRMAIHLLKYSGAEKIAVKLGFLIADKIVDDEKLSMSETIAPVPLHAARKRERGYNQSELIANEISLVLKLRQEPNLLKRVRQTQTQTHLDPEGRRKNISGAFVVGREHLTDVRGRKILLVDDVITTGSTIKECARVLKENGASEVYAASAAIAI